MADERMLTVEEVAERLKIGKETVRRWLRRGELRGAQIGGRKLGYRVKERDLAAFLKERGIEEAAA